VRTGKLGRGWSHRAREFQPDLILLDVMMPGIDGGEVAAKIKEDKRLVNIPVVFLSAIVKKEETQPTGGQYRRTHLFWPSPSSSMIWSPA